MRKIKRLSLALAALTLFATACGGDDSSSSSSTTAAAEAATTAAPAAAESDGASAEVPEGAIAVELAEFTLTAPAEIEGGSVTFSYKNNGEFGHELAIAKGDSYDVLPQTDIGAVDEAALGADFLGRGDKVDGGATGTVTWDLAPGNYVLMCNITSGPNSHAQKGQVMSITVT